MLLQLTDFSVEPLYRQISRQMAERIRRGELANGKCLDPVRTLARGQRVSIKTAERAYQELLKEGLIERRQKNNYLVSQPPRGTSAIAAVEKERNDSSQARDFDHQQASRIQNQLFPAGIFSDKNITVAATSKACDIVGGDMYDYFHIDKNRYGVVIADACGHGVVAALLITQIQAIIKSEVKNGSSAEETMHFINSHIRASFTRGKFLTLFYGIVDTNAQKITYINAGHNFPFIVKKSGGYEFLTNSSPALGLFDDMNFTIGTADLYHGDRLILYTDGITEAMNNSREEFGEERLLEIVRNNRQKTPAGIIKRVQKSLSSHASDVNRDDRTLLILHVNEKNYKSGRTV